MPCSRRRRYSGRFLSLSLLLMQPVAFAINVQRERTARIDSCVLVKKLGTHPGVRCVDVSAEHRYSSGNIPLRKEQCFHLRGRLILHVREHMCIGIERKGCAGMSQLLRHHLWRHPVSRLFLLIPFLRYTTNVLPGCCPDGRLATPLPFPSAPYGREPHRCNW